MNYEELIQAMTPDMHQSLKRAVELGKWPDEISQSMSESDLLIARKRMVLSMGKILCSRTLSKFL